MITAKVLKTLEYDKILERLKNFTGSERAGREVALLVPAEEYAEVSTLLRQTEEADRLLHEFALNLSFSFDDIAFILERAEKNSVLTMDELLKIARVLKSARQIKTAVTKISDGGIILLREMAELLFTDKVMEEKIFSSILSAHEMADGASPELRSIRHRIKRCNEEIRAKLNHFITSAAYQKYLQDNVITLRDNRHVILLRSEFKGAIPGLIHGQSSTGSTLYVEPMAVFELNNKLKALLSDEAFEIERILRGFTLEVGGASGFLKYGFELMTKLDIIFAKAAFAKSVRAVKPKLLDAPYLDIIKGRHPLIAPDKVVPITLSLGKSFNILMITGPNTGGKTVTLKLAGLFALMTQTGLFLPAHEDTVMGVFSGVYADIGDEQSIEQSLSTFSSHMTNIIGILKAFDGRSLVLFDELGAGTDPQEGAAIALAVTAYLRENQAKAVITTHYNELKEFSLTEDNVENASMDFDPLTFAPNYRLAIGVPGSSNAIRIAERLGLPKEISEKAGRALGEERRQFDRIILAAENARKKAEEALIAADTKKAEAAAILGKLKEEKNAFELERERFRQSVKKDAKEVLESAEEEAREILDEMKELLKKSDESALFEARKLRKRLEDSKDRADDGAAQQAAGEEIVKESGAIEAGDSVYLASLNARGVVVEIIKDDAMVEIGGLRTYAGLRDLVKIRRSDEDKRRLGGRAVNLSKPLSVQAVPSEINLIGKNIEEALYLLEGFLDRAVTGGLGEIRIIHGMGTGKLGRAVQAYLKEDKNIASFRYGIHGEGARGVTVAVLK